MHGKSCYIRFVDTYGSKIFGSHTVSGHRVIFSFPETVSDPKTRIFLPYFNTRRGLLDFHCMTRRGLLNPNLPHSHRVSSSFRIQKLICKLRLRLLMILVPASDCLQHKFGANGLNGRNLNVRAVEVQLDSVAGTKLLGLKIDNCF